MAILIKASGEPNRMSPRNGKKFELEEAQSLVGGYIQIISIGNDEVMVFDEEGKIKEKKENRIATWIARDKKAIFLCDYIVGDVIICKDNEI